MIGIKQEYQKLFFQTEQTVNRKKSGFRAAQYLVRIYQPQDVKHYLVSLFS